MNKIQVEQYIHDRRFAELFVKLGWDTDRLPQESLLLRTRDGDNLSVKRVAEKRGFVICICDVENGYPATISDRRRLVNQLARFHYEHLLIFCGEGKQSWTIAIRPKNRPLRTVEVEWHENQDIQPLMEKLDGMVFHISEEENLTITDVVDRVRNVFMENAERITRSFYREFREELSAFAEFIVGIQNQVSKEWYAALMLNRLMFIYFIQKKKFLDGDTNYLENRLRNTQQTYGKDKFHDRFYRFFLRQLFEQGLGKPESERSPELKQLLGKIPYLNGGLFDIHEIEEQNKHLDIKDEAFGKLFAFFGQYNWHLDDRPTATGKDINPDVIGYIFEKYINDRASMGAYYTQEDITGYIARNTIIPFLLHCTKEECKNAFDSESGVWQFLRERPDDYIYDAVKKGCDIPDEEMPENIRRGMDTQAPGLIERRKDWNTQTEGRFALPTEIWRETIARRKRYFELKAKMENGDICEIDDLITHNLDIERFAYDALRWYEGSDFIAAFFKAIAGQKSLRSNHKEQRGITILDPACGSGAFLFAALNVLEPLYDQCIKRMEDFVEEDERLRKEGKRKGMKKHLQFREFLEEISEHPNQNYWIYKTIILNNLYGVDLMKEAAEIAKLRLFLKLAAEAEYEPRKDNLGLDPLPDIDFNIRSGNSLVGFASMKQFEQSMTPEKGQQLMDLSGGLVEKIQEEAKLVQKANDAFKKAQDASDKDYQQAKLKLKESITTLNDKMNYYLASQYGKNEKKADYEQWLESHKPFHWLTEFYGIVEEDGGFDVVIGNPPYVEYSKIKKIYKVRDYQTGDHTNIYTFFFESINRILSNTGKAGVIVPISFSSSPRMNKVREYVFNSSRKVWLSHYSIRPAPLFSGVMQRHTIVITSVGHQNKVKGLSVTNYIRWRSIERDKLFISKLVYEDVSEVHSDEKTVPKISIYTGKNILNKILQNSSGKIRESIVRESKKLFFHDSGESYWTKVLWESPTAYRNGKVVSPTHWFSIDCKDEDRSFIYLFLNSSLFYWLWAVYTDCRDLTKNFVETIPLPKSRLVNHSLVDKLRQAYTKNTFYVEKRSNYKSPEIKVRNFKKLLDRIDGEVASCYGLSEEELDYIINYDIKYRMGLQQ